MARKSALRVIDITADPQFVDDTEARFEDGITKPAVRRLELNVELTQCDSVPRKPLRSNRQLPHCRDIGLDGGQVDRFVRPQPRRRTSETHAALREADLIGDDCTRR
ncbi:MAG: hypothetical protein JWO05_1032 [Gemmatimonadetes bacterium]|nr:hypothetical protein [Gemmatimonadota bacterium]